MTEIALSLTQHNALGARDVSNPVHQPLHILATSFPPGRSETEPACSCWTTTWTSRSGILLVWSPLLSPDWTGNFPAGSKSRVYPEAGMHEHPPHIQGSAASGILAGR